MKVKIFLYSLFHRKEIGRGWNKIKELAVPVKLRKRKVKNFYRGWKNSFIKYRLLGR